MKRKNVKGYTQISKACVSKSEACEGYTLIEILVVIVIFAVISLVATQTLISILRATRKADAVLQVRQNLDYAMGVVERQIRSAKSITSACNSTPATDITISDQYGNPVTFSCVNINSNGDPSSVASSSASLTGTNITLSACSFTCMPATSSSPASVLMTVTGGDINSQNAVVTVTTQVTLRTY